MQRKKNTGQSAAQVALDISDSQKCYFTATAQISSLNTKNHAKSGNNFYWVVCALSLPIKNHKRGKKIT